ncbi:MAG: ATP-binding protein [Candidatus Omnitrophota bacterium]
MGGAKNRKAVQNFNRGKLRIGDDWNAITIIALSQNNPLKAIAEFVENSIDAGARGITIIRGKNNGRQYIRIIDDGQGIPCTEEGVPDFKYVATHICDSLKRRLKTEGFKNIQGEFGIGLLSFWTVGHKLTVISSGRNGKAYQMDMEKGKPGYSITCRHRLVSEKGTQLIISPLLEGIRVLNGEKIQCYLASELRDRIRNSGVKIKIIDRTGRAEFDVEPRQYSGQLLHAVPQITTPFGDVYIELYLDEKNPENCISLFRSGTRLLPSIRVLDAFQKGPWASEYFQGIIDAPFLHLTPGTRDGVILDEKFAAFIDSLEPLRERLSAIEAEQVKAEEECMSRNILRSVQKAFKEALLALPREEYDWFDVYKNSRRIPEGQNNPLAGDRAVMFSDDAETEKKPDAQKKFFEVSGPLFSARIQPCSALVQSGGTRPFRAAGLDRSKRQVEENLIFTWEIAEGAGSLDKTDSEITVFNASAEPGLTKLRVKVQQGDIVCEAGSIVTIVDSLSKSPSANIEFPAKGLPSYTLESAPGQLWRSRYDDGRNIVVINSGHRDFIYAGRNKTRKLRYICRLFAKELIFRNFPGSPAEQMLERMVELSLYAEENLK